MDWVKSQNLVMLNGHLCNYFGDITETALLLVVITLHSLFIWEWLQLSDPQSYHTK